MFRPDPVDHKIRCCAALLALLWLMCSAAGAASVYQPANEQQANRQALSLFCHCAFHPEFAGSDEEARLNRWAQEITIWMGGSPTAEDRAFLDQFLAELNGKVTGFPGIRRVKEDAQASIRMWFVPQYMLPYYLEDYVDGNSGFFQYDHPKDIILSARVGISTDAVDQQERNHLILEELTGALGLPGDHEIYSDSILYDPWTTVQQLSDVDWRMLNMLYHPALTPGMTEDQAREALKKELNL